MIRILPYSETNFDQIFSRVEPKVDVAQIVSEIISNVRQNGDQALFEYCERFDRVKLETLEVSAEELDAAFKQVDPEFIRILESAAANIRKFRTCSIRDFFFR